MKKILLTAALAVLSCAVPACAEPVVSILWLPAQDAPILPVLSEIGKNPGFKLTVALAPEVVTEAVKLRLQALEYDGQTETVLRIFGDPPLPLIYSPQSAEVTWPGKNDKKLWSSRLDELAARIFRERNLFESKFTREPVGWVPQAGGVTAEMLSLTRAYSMKWIASGPSDGGSRAVSGDEDVSVIPFVRVNGMPEFEALLADGTDEPVFAVIDESIPQPEGEISPRQLLLDIIASTQTLNWQTVSGALQGDIYRAELDPENPYRPWTGDYSLWAGTARQQGALRNLDEALRNYGIARNSSVGSGGAKLQREFDEIQSASSLFVLGSTVPEAGFAAEEKFKSRLKGIYRTINRPIPPSLSQPFADGGDGDGEGSGSETGQSASFKNGPGWLRIDHPVKNLRLPESFARRNVSTGAFAVDFMQTDWTDKSITFTLKTAGGDADIRRLLLADIYIDMNHRPRSGLTELLDGRVGLKTSADDAWEFAFSVCGNDARFYQATPEKASYRKSYPVLVKNGEVSFSVPRTDLRGNPENWGYCVIVMSAGHATPDLIYPEHLADKSVAIDTVALDRLGSTLYLFRLPKKY